MSFYQVTYVIRFFALHTSVADLGCVAGGQIFVVFRVQQMQELSSLSADHHLGRIRMSGTYTVDLLVLRAEWHLGVSVFIGMVKKRQMLTYSCAWETALLEMKAELTYLDYPLSNCLAWLLFCSFSWFSSF